MHFGQAKANKSQFGCFEMILKLTMNSHSINRFVFKLMQFFMTFTCGFEWN